MLAGGQPRPSHAHKESTVTATITRDEIQAGVDAGTLVLVDALPDSGVLIA